MLAGILPPGTPVETRRRRPRRGRPRHHRPAQAPDPARRGHRRGPRPASGRSGRRSPSGDRPRSSSSTSARPRSRPGGRSRSRGASWRASPGRPAVLPDAGPVRADRRGRRGAQLPAQPRGGAAGRPGLGASPAPTRDLVTLRQRILTVGASTGSDPRPHRPSRWLSASDRPVGKPRRGPRAGFVDSAPPPRCQPGVGWPPSGWRRGRRVEASLGGRPGGVVCRTQDRSGPAHAVEVAGQRDPALADEERDVVRSRAGRRQRPAAGCRRHR